MSFADELGIQEHPDPSHELGSTPESFQIGTPEASPLNAAKRVSRWGVQDGAEVFREGVRDELGKADGIGVSSPTADKRVSVSSVPGAESEEVSRDGPKPSHSSEVSFPKAERTKRHSRWGIQDETLDDEPPDVAEEGLTAEPELSAKLGESSPKLAKRVSLPDESEDNVGFVEAPGPKTIFSAASAESAHQAKRKASGRVSRMFESMFVESPENERSQTEQSSSDSVPSPRTALRKLLLENVEEAAVVANSSPVADSGRSPKPTSKPKPRGRVSMMFAMGASRSEVLPTNHCTSAVSAFSPDSTSEMLFSPSDRAGQGRSASQPNVFDIATRQQQATMDIRRGMVKSGVSAIRKLANSADSAISKQRPSQAEFTFKPHINAKSRAIDEKRFTRVDVQERLSGPKRPSKYQPDESEFTFNPSLNERSRTIDEARNAADPRDGPRHEAMTEYHAWRLDRIAQRKQEHFEEEMSYCPFKPSVVHNRYRNEKFAHVEAKFRELAS